MNKTLYLLPAVVLWLPLAAQTEYSLPVDEDTKLVTYTEVVDVPNTGKAELYRRAKEWFEKESTYKEASKKINKSESPDKITGEGTLKIHSTGIFLIHPDHQGYVRFQFVISIKDGKYKYAISKISHTAKYSGGAVEDALPDCGYALMNEKVWKNLLREQIDTKMKHLLNNLKEHMEKSAVRKVEEKKTDDW